MVEIATPIATETPVAKELKTPDVSIRRLNPEIPNEFNLARAVDEASLEAYNIEVYTHDAMTDDQLKEWHREDAQNMLRYVTIDPQKFGVVVDVKQFHQAIQKAIDAKDQKLADALRTMEKEGIVGFTYIYNHTKTDADFKRREEELRKRMNIPNEEDVCEMNFWYVPGTKDAPAEQGTQLTLTELASKRTQKTTTVMFVDSEDIGDTARELMTEHELTIKTRNQKVSDRDVLTFLAKDKDADEKVKQRFPDTRILQKIGFTYEGDMMYTSEEKLPSWIYARTILPTPVTPPVVSS